MNRSCSPCLNMILPQNQSLNLTSTVSSDMQRSHHLTCRHLHPIQRHPLLHILIYHNHHSGHWNLSNNNSRLGRARVKLTGDSFPFPLPGRVPLASGHLHKAQLAVAHLTLYKGWVQYLSTRLTIQTVCGLHQEAVEDIPLAYTII